MIIGFTGTRRGMTAQQTTSVYNFLEKFDSFIGLHGDCIGADKDFHGICQNLNMVIHSRPCILTSQRAFTNAIIIAESEKPLDRNKKIVDDSTLMLACPGEFEEVLRSGTWSTIRYAKKNKREIYIVFPDGTSEFFK